MIFSDCCHGVLVPNEKVYVDDSTQNLIFKGVIINLYPHCIASSEKSNMKLAIRIPDQVNWVVSCLTVILRAINVMRLYLEIVNP
mmetsp:Transcript_30724/g.27926  ORF Transcript_30724/g.27926 Transcript_30724/m.27926 type:complete len:85 (+) Transcript_30724:63-317(+)